MIKVERNRYSPSSYNVSGLNKWYQGEVALHWINCRESTTLEVEDKFSDFKEVKWSSMMNMDMTFEYLHLTD